MPPLFGPHTVTALNDEAAPPLPSLDASEGATAQGMDVGYERAPAAWTPIAATEPAGEMPRRFLDGTIVSRLAGSLNVGGRLRPLVAATYAAVALRLDQRLLTRGSHTVVRSAVAVYNDDIEPAVLLHARETLQACGVELLERAMDSGPRHFDALRLSTRNRAMDAMEFAERDVLLADRETPTLIDGLLERRLVGVPDRRIPVTGLVKQQVAIYLPESLQEMLYTLQPGQRTPAFVMTIDNVPLVNLYLRLANAVGGSPSGGVVRVTTPYEYLESMPSAARWAHLSALAGYLYRLRCRDVAYERAAISIEPVVRVEEHLRAIRPDIDRLVRRLHGLMHARELVGASA